MDKDEAVEVLSEFAQYMDEYIVRPAVPDIRAALEESHWKSIGEYLRDAAVLIIVFVPLDYFITRAAETHQPLPAKVWIGVAALSLILLIAGIACSRRGNR